MSESAGFDVVIVGGSVAGCTAAIRFAQEGRSVALLEKQPSEDHYKKLCTHFVQPNALPILRKIGVARLIEEAGVLPTKGAFWTTAGWIDPPGPYAEDPDRAHAYAVERRILDPLLRRLAQRSNGITLLTRSTCDGVEKTHGDPYRFRVRYLDSEGSTAFLCCKLLVAADGRHSSIAREAGNEATLTPNDRAACLAYFTGIDRPPEARCLFYLLGQDTCFLYPLPEGRTLLSVCIEKEKAKAWRAGDPVQAMLEQFQGLPNIPSLRHARAASPLYGYSDYPNSVRKPVCREIAFIGDAVLSLDAMAGVGVGFALVQADLLATALSAHLEDRPAFEAALASYEACFHEKFDSQISGIQADSRILKQDETREDFFEIVKRNIELQHEYLALTGRLITPDQFQRSYLRTWIQSQARPGIASV